MSNDVSAYYEARTTAAECEAFARAFADDPAMENFDVSYLDGSTVISSMERVSDSDPCEAKIAEILKKSTAAFS